jgi:hypothetical protein
MTHRDQGRVGGVGVQEAAARAVTAKRLPGTGLCLQTAKNADVLTEDQQGDYEKQECGSLNHERLGRRADSHHGPPRPTSEVSFQLLYEHEKGRFPGSEPACDLRWRLGWSLGDLNP